MVSGGGSTVAERRNQRVASLIASLIAEHELMTGEVNLDLLCQVLVTLPIVTPRVVWEQLRAGYMCFPNYKLLLTRMDDF